MGEAKILKRNLFVSFVIITILILCSGALGWEFTKRIEDSNKIIGTVHTLKEAELQLRREEKNLLLRGYSNERYLRWQRAKEDFHQSFGSLIGMQALKIVEINELKTSHSEMSDTYGKFFDEIRSKLPGRNEIAVYDKDFQQLGRNTIVIINNILSREQEIASKTDTQTNILMAAFLFVFVATTGFLTIKVTKHIL